MIQTWQITPTRTTKLDLNVSSLDEITRLLPEGYYSTFRTFDGCTRVIGLPAHLRRLYGPVSSPDVGAIFLRRQLRTLLEPYRSDEARVRVIMTRQGQVYIAIEPLKLLPRDVYEKGVHVEIADLRREHPRLKSTAFIGRSDSERKHIAQEGIFEALLVKNGKILEGITSNFFYVEQVGNLSYVGTAQHEILPGVTRKTVIAIARGRGLEVKYQALKLNQISAVDEAFVTSSSRGIVPVVKIDDVTIGQGTPGAITNQLIEAYERYVIEKAERI